ncbi:unnamed protein product [Gongylonema pulchrum]|uniref:40S ribosomal protein S24 n=1 Tax=Gongylonema pulchrum TaxID=637853 RepID=A0A183ESY8_9BILA|nr:unnamed protein product [Gongylonema pulchrum]
MEYEERQENEERKKQDVVPENRHRCCFVIADLKFRKFFGHKTTAAKIHRSLNTFNIFYGIEDHKGAL